MGAGLIGRRHIEHILREDCATLAAVVDPDPAAQEVAAAGGAPWYPDLPAMLARDRPEGVIVATPSPLHVRNGMDCVAAGLPALIEKPLADDVTEAERLVDAAGRAGVPLLAGHHRRHNPLVAEAKRAVDAGRLGRVVAVHATCWFHKPPEYFDPAWRRAAGAGPVLTNLVHDMDLLRHLCGDVVQVQAMDSNALRGHAVEDTAVILLRFAGGALGTVTVSDAVSAPWSWEFTSGENPAYTRTGESCYLIGGTAGSLALPHLDLWRHEGRPDWWAPLGRERLPADAADPLALQIRNLCGVIRGTAAPLVPARDGLEALRVIAAVKQAAATGQAVRVG